MESNDEELNEETIREITEGIGAVIDTAFDRQNVALETVFDRHFGGMSTALDRSGNALDESLRKIELRRFATPGLPPLGCPQLTPMTYAPTMDNQRRWEFPGTTRILVNGRECFRSGWARPIRWSRY